MAEDKRLDTLQEEIKLMKGELKQSLASVRDYLLNMELPSSEISNILSALGDEGEKVTMKGSLDTPKEQKPPEPPVDALTETEESLEDEALPEGDDLLDLEDNPDEEEEQTNPEDSLTSEDDGLSPSDNVSSPEDELSAPEDNIDAPEDTSYVPEETFEDKEDEPESFEPDSLEPEMSSDDEQPMQEEQPMLQDKTTEDMTLSVPKVNMLANLINWVARANKEIGRDQIPTFLEVYGISGHLSPELKDVIIHLSEITEEDTEASSSTEIWSQSMLLLHGILTGGDAPLHPAIPSWNNEEKAIDEEEIIEVDKSKEKPFKLKLILPNEDGEEKEFCINLTQEANGNNDK
jgi:hypothetical protein